MEVLLQVAPPVVLPVVQLGILVILGASKVLVSLSVLLQAVLLVNYRFLPCPEKSVSPMSQSVVSNTKCPPKSAGRVVAGVCPKEPVMTGCGLDASILFA